VPKTACLCNYSHNGIYIDHVGTSRTLCDAGTDLVKARQRGGFN
jgi:hypothetical protein